MDLGSQMKSIRGLINTLFPTVTIHLDRVTSKFNRPAFTVQNVDLTAQPITKALHSDKAIWSIRYLGNSRDEVLAVLDKIRVKLMELVIPCYLYDYVPLAPTLTALDGGGLAGGVYRVTVTGVNPLGEETLASPEVSTTLEAGQALQIRIPRTDKGLGYFSSYRIYVGEAGGTVVLRTEVPIAETSNTSVILPSLNVGVKTAPTTSKVFARFLRVDKVNAHAMEDLDDSEKWDGVMTVTTSLMRVAPQRVAELIQVIGVTGKLER